MNPQDAVSSLFSSGLLLIYAVIAIGLIVALAQLVLGHPSGLRNIVLIGAVAFGLALWRSGALGSVWSSLVHSAG